MDGIDVVVTMDCEKPHDGAIAGVTGPASWADSHRFIEHYAAINLGHGFPVSFFLHPEVVPPHRALFADLEQAGHCIDGLHLHPWKYEPGGLRQHFGLLDEDAQRRVLSIACRDWQAAMGRAPRYFRPGTFSASDASYRVAGELGFIGGSLSVPGRVFPDLGAVWSGCPPDPHHADPAFRIRPGAMRFANMPLTVDFAQTLQRGIRSWHPDLRPDRAYDDLPGQVDRVVEQIRARAPRFPVINIVTHNDNDYGDPANPVRRNLEALLAAIRRSSERHGLRCRGETIAGLCARVLDSDPELPAFKPV